MRSNLEDGTLILLGGLFLIGGYLSIVSSSIISLFISIEVLSFTIIILINLYIQDQYTGIIYYLISGLFTGLFILSLGYLYLGYLISYKLILIVFLFKLGIVPFHIILPLIYTNLSPNNIFIIDIPYKIILFYVIIKLNLNYYSYFYIIFILFFSSLASLRYQNLIYIMIYSSILNYGIILSIIYLNNISIFLYYILYYSIFILIYLYLLTNYYINKQIISSFYLYC
jgi:NADH:ubiquinone oxidoreductase subunit 2 (subunit N)